MYWQYTPFVLPVIVAGTASLVIAGLVWQRRATAGTTPFGLLTLALAVWSLGNALELGCVELADKLFWADVQYMGIVSMPVLWLIFALRYASWGRKPARQQMITLAIVPLVTVILVWTNDLHGLMRRDIGLDSSGPLVLVTKTYGPWFWVHTAYSYFAMATGSFVLLRATFRAPNVYRSQALALLVAVLLPWVGNAVYVLGQSTLTFIDPTPVFFTLSCIIMVWALFHYGFLDIVPAARDAIIENMADGVIVLDTQSRIVDINPAAENILGCSASEAIGQSPSQVMTFGLDLIARHRDLAPTRTVVTIPKEEGSHFYSLRISPLYDAKHRLSGRLIVFSDVTERKRFEARVNHMQKMEAVGRLAGGISHEFNNLLTVLNGYSQFVWEGLNPDDPLREDMKEIRLAGRRATALVRQLLAFSHRETQEMSILDINKIIEGLGKMLSRLIEDVSIETHLAPDVGCIEAGSGQIEQMLVNLATNARDAIVSAKPSPGDDGASPGSANGGLFTIETANITLDAEGAARHVELEPGDYVMLTVSDTGCGMSPETLEHIFEPFFTTKGIGKGTGLGLAMVYGTVQQAGGSIEVNSAPGEGTTFKIYFPRVYEPLAAKEANREESAPPKGAETVLVVEDQEQVREVTASMLRRLGYTVLEGADGARALDLVRDRSNSPDLVIADAIMPGMGGRELLQQMRQARRNLKVLYVSGYPQEVLDDYRALEPGATVLAKPFTLNALATSARQVLDSSI